MTKVPYIPAVEAEFKSRYILFVYHMQKPGALDGPWNVE